MFGRLKNDRGVAYILVIAALMYLSVLVVDFYEGARTGHRMVVNMSRRVQSYYLAKSALSLSKLLLYYNKKIESTLSKNKLSYSDVGFDALYKQVPINSELLRGLISAAGVSTESGGEGADGESEAGSDLDQVPEGVGLLERDKIESFLDFDGNFYAEISEERSKYSLNAISRMTPTSSSYDLHKRILLSLLMRPEFKNFFEYQERDAEELVHAIADFVDSNNSINEFNQVERGREESAYDRVDYKVKNAPLLTLSELRLVAGMSDDIYETLKPLVTVYHTDDKVNICLAPPEIVEALIVHYTRYSECTTPLDPEDTEYLDKLRNTILAACPDKTEVAKSLNRELGIQTVLETEDQASTAETKATASKVAGCKIQFEDLITEDNDIFRVKASGEVQGVRTTITVVTDTSGSRAKSWKTLYYQVD